VDKKGNEKEWLNILMVYRRGCGKCGVKQAAWGSVRQKDLRRDIGDTRRGGGGDVPAFAG
jgi:hypothetical protein